MNNGTDDLSRRLRTATPRTLRRMAQRERTIAEMYRHWAENAERLAISYDDLADVREERRLT